MKNHYLNVKKLNVAVDNMIKLKYKTLWELILKLGYLNIMVRWKILFVEVFETFEYS